MTKEWRKAIKLLSEACKYGVLVFNQVADNLCRHTHIRKQARHWLQQ